MDQLELFHWAYSNYQKEFEGNREDHLFKKGVNSKKYTKDAITMVEVECAIDDDWIKAIDFGLKYVAKAIREDRQFIRNEGEVLPIEKIRRVSKDSIVDLSKHSNYITRLPEEEDENLVPDKLLMIKRENDYSIYENRVLYTTLAYLKEFVASRLEKIKEVTNKYEGVTHIEKKIDLGYRSIDFVMNLVENRRNDPITVANNGYQEKIQQLDAILNEILILLKTPLMQEVSKSPMVSRPITKTNVLKMNTNFKESLALFDYICAYDKPGYTVTKKEKKIYPLSEAQENSFNDVIQLVSFLSYQYNNGLEKRLADAFKKESSRRLHLKDQELLDRIEELKAKAKRNPTENAEYIMQLEQSYDVLKRAVSDAKEETEATKAEAENKIEELNEAHETEKGELKAALEERLRSLEEELAQANERLEAEKKASDAIAAELNEKIDLLSTELLASKLYAKDKGINLFDFTTRERFTKLEEEKKVLDRFFEKAWRATKKEIRKKHYDFSKKEGGEQ